MMKQKYTLIMYLFTLIRNIQLLFNGYSNKLTGFWLIVNMIFILIFYIRLLFKNQKFNEYIIGFILGFTFFSIDFSSFRDYNKRFNTWIIVILILLIFLQFLMLIKIFIKNKKYKEIFLLILSFIGSKLFLSFLIDYYLEPRKIIYSTNIKYIKDDKELKKIIERMPMVNEVDIINSARLNKSDYYDDYYKNDGSSENLDEIINVSMKHSVNYESINLLANKIREFLKLQNKEKKFIKIYFTNRYNYYEALSIYDLKNDKLTEIYLNESLQSDSGLISNLLLNAVKIATERVSVSLQKKLVFASSTTHSISIFFNGIAIAGYP